MKKIGILLSLLALFAVMVTVSLSDSKAETVKVKPAIEIASISVLEHTVAVEVLPENMERIAQIKSLIKELPAKTNYREIADAFTDVGRYATNADIDGKLQKLAERTGISANRLRRAFNDWQSLPVRN